MLDDLCNYIHALGFWWRDRPRWPGRRSVVVPMTAETAEAMRKFANAVLRNVKHNGGRSG